MWLLHLLAWLPHLSVSTCTTRDLLVFIISSVATYCELDLWTWSVIKSVWIFQAEIEYLAPRYPCSCLDLSKKQPLESCNYISSNLEATLFDSSKPAMNCEGIRKIRLRLGGPRNSYPISGSEPTYMFWLFARGHTKLLSLLRDQ